MKWTRSFRKQDGSVRAQFSSWKVPASVLDRGKLRDGDNCRISISVASFHHAGRYVLTSGGEFRVSAQVRDKLAALSESDPDLEVEFYLFKDRSSGEEDLEFEKQVTESKMLDPQSRKRRLEAAIKVPKRRKVTMWEFIRNPDVVAEVLLRADGICENCRSAAPFLRAVDQTPYLEVHHKKRLADGGEDSVENAIALCPNCHRKFHHG